MSDINSILYERDDENAKLHDRLFFGLFQKSRNISQYVQFFKILIPDVK